MAQHQRRREPIVRLDVVAEVLDERHDDVDRRHVCAGSARDYLDEAEVVDVLVGQDHELEIGDRMAELVELVLELVERLAGVGPGVDQRERVVLDQVAVDAAHAERRGDG